MIKELKRLLKKYKDISKQSEYVSIHEVTNDIYHLMGEVRVKRLPKDER